MQSTNYAAPHNAVFSILLSLHHSSAQIFPSTPCSQTPPNCALTMRSETKSSRLYRTTTRCIFIVSAALRGAAGVRPAVWSVEKRSLQSLVSRLFDEVKCFCNWSLFLPLLALNRSELKASEQWRCVLCALDRCCQEQHAVALCSQRGSRLNQYQASCTVHNAMSWQNRSYCRSQF
jgi:hypothetical protein